MEKQNRDDDVRPAGRRERKKLAVERRIRRAAADLFERKGYDETTVGEIAERADVAKGTVFNYFPRKDALLEAFRAELYGEVEAELGPVDTWPGSIREQVTRLLFALVARAERNPELFRTMVIENMRTFWARPDCSPGSQPLRRLLRAVMTRACPAGEGAAGDDVQSAVKLLEAAYVTTMVEWVKDGGPGEELRAELTRRVDIILRGIGVSMPAGEGGET